MRDALDAVFPAWNGLAVAGRTDTGVHATGQVASVRGRRRPAAGAGGEGAQRGAAGRRRRPRRGGGAGPTSAPASRPARVRTATGSCGAACARRSRRAGRSGGRSRSTATALDAAAALLPGTHDFTAFTPTETQHTRFERTVLAAAWEEHGDELHFTIEAVSFLRHMVRILVGSMLEGLRARAAARGPPPRARQARPRRRGGSTWSASSTDRRRYDRSSDALPGRPLRLRRHRDRLRLDHHRLDAARDEDRARPRHPRRGARARGRRLRPDRADAPDRRPSASTSSSPATASTTSRCTPSSPSARG